MAPPYLSEIFISKTGRWGRPANFWWKPRDQGANVGVTGLRLGDEPPADISDDHWPGPFKIHFFRMAFNSKKSFYEAVYSSVISLILLLSTYRSALLYGGALWWCVFRVHTPSDWRVFLVAVKMIDTVHISKKYCFENTTRVNLEIK